MDIDKLIEETQKIKQLQTQLESLVAKHTEIIIIGNGGSNAISSHISQDYTKELDKKAICFSDPSRLTCYINDYGRDQAYVEFIKDFVSKDTLVILISSSGNSMNIVNAAVYCELNLIDYIALSGFNKDNKLNNLNGKLKFWVDSHDYGIVECTHQAFLHSIL
jgi:D-sedoheptulose 7-phosphate isomerase